MGSMLMAHGTNWGDFQQSFGVLEGVLISAVFLGAFQQRPDRHESIPHPFESDLLDSIGGNMTKGIPFLEASGRSQSGQHKATGVELSAFTPETRSKLMK